MQACKSKVKVCTLLDPQSAYPGWKNLKLHLSEHITTAVQVEKSREELARGPGRENLIRLDCNENPWGPSPSVVRALAAAELSRYPDPSGFALVQRLARNIGVTSGEIVLGNGSTEIVELLMRSLVQPGFEVIISFPSSLLYQRCVQILDGQNIIIPLRRLSHDLESIQASISEKTRLIVLDNPNNVTGTVINPGDFYSFLSGVPESVVVLLNEAYVDFMDNEKLLDTFSLIRNTKNRCGVVVVRSFSKAYGLAGLRCGYGIMPEEISRCLLRLRQPYSVGGLALAAAQAALADEHYLRQTQERTRQGKEYLREEVKKLGCTCYPSQTNFLLVDLQMNADALCLALSRRGVIVRSMAAYGLIDCIRISVGTDFENRNFITVFAECLQGFENA